MSMYNIKVQNNYLVIHIKKLSQELYTWIVLKMQMNHSMLYNHTKFFSKGSKNAQSSWCYDDDKNASRIFIFFIFVGFFP